MEFKGNEFIRNVEIEKEKAELKKRTDALDAQKNKSVINNGYSDISLESPQYFQDQSNESDINDEPVLLDIKRESQTRDLDDILLENNSQTNNNNKKKYIYLTISLIILFILTITIIQLISEDTKENRLFVKPNIEKIEQDNILSSTDADKKYQQIIDKKTKKTIQKKLNLDTIVKKEIPLPKEKKKTIKKNRTKKVKKTITDVFGMEQKPVIKKTIKSIKKLKPRPKPKPKPIIKKIQKPITKSVVKSKPKIIPKKTTGTFVQVGAFTKAPSKKLLNTIKKYGYNYTIVKMTIKGRLYNKVLIGPYTNKQKTSKALSKIKKDLNNKNAYILKLK